MAAILCMYKNLAWLENGFEKAANYMFCNTAEGTKIEIKKMAVRLKIPLTILGPVFIKALCNHTTFSPI